MTTPIVRLNAALTGRYAVERELGAGGMATVYLADDVKHERKVALKVLKPELAAIVGAERFLAEIKTTANLQHPHVLPLHDSGEADGFLFYVMPYVEGESLREKLDREHQLAVDEAVRIATNVAEALDYAHRRGVIHRDIKPANILLLDGKPVVSDFGIALALGTAGQGRLTETGLSLGTPHYMSPEQATGDLSVGAATDVYALGCVLYEMLVGEPPYTGSTPQAVLGRIVTGEPRSVTEERSTVPAHVDAVVRRALEKVPADRFGTAGEMARALGDVGFRWGERVATAAGEGVGAAAAWKHATLVLAVVLVALTWWASGRPTDGTLPTRYSQLLLPGGVQVTDVNTPLAISEDGTRVVYNASDDEGRVLRTFRLGERGSDVTVAGTRGATSFALSPNGNDVVFFAGGEGVIKRVAVAGGQPTTVAGTGLNPGQCCFYGASWGPDNVIVFGTRESGLQRVSAAGGTPAELTRAGLGRGAFHFGPEVLPDGSGVVFTLIPGAAALDRRPQVAIMPFGGEPAVLTQGHSPHVTEDGILIFSREPGELWAARLTDDRSQLASEPLLVMQGGPAGGDNARYALSTDGTLLYLPEGSFGAPLARVLAWVDRDGSVEDIVSIPDAIPDADDVGTGTQAPRLSPDGSRIALRTIVGEEELFAVFVSNLQGAGLTRLPVEVNADWPVWLDDERLIFNRFVLRADESQELYIAPADGSGAATPWTAPNELQQHVQQVTPDGSSLLIQQRPVIDDADADLLVVPFDDPDQATPVFDFPEATAEIQGSIDPSGRWLAYASNRSGRFEVYITEFPRGLRHTRVSENGGDSPVWSPAGGELFYRNRFEIRVVAVSTEPSIALGADELVYDGPSAWCCPQGGYARTFDVSADGQRILLVRLVEEPGSSATLDVPRIEMAQGWLQEVERRVSN